MLPITQEWADKAEGDWASAGRDYRARKSPNFDGACYHAQQCAEKYLKGRLQEAVVSFPRSHDLEFLLDLVLPSEPTWASLRLALRRLTTYAVIYRYPGRIATKAEAREAIAL
jgi:HEPN domain-containing protein